MGCRAERLALSVDFCLLDIKVVPRLVQGLDLYVILCRLSGRFVGAWVYLGFRLLEGMLNYVVN